jgi:fatty acid desaturase
MTTITPADIIRIRHAAHHAYVNANSSDRSRIESRLNRILYNVETELLTVNEAILAAQRLN